MVESLMPIFLMLLGALGTYYTYKQNKIGEVDQEGRLNERLFFSASAGTALQTSVSNLAEDFHEFRVEAKEEFGKIHDCLRDK